MLKCYNYGVKPFESPNPFLPDEDLVRRTSRAVLHSAEKGKQSRFELLTAAHAKRLELLMKQEPIFYENKEDAPRQILLDPELSDAMPPEFFENPTQWLENLPNIRRGYEKHMGLPRGETIEELWGKTYDISKVKEFALDKADGSEIQVVSKRIDPKQTEEVALARKAYEAGIPTPKVLGEVADRGNLYALFEKINGRNVNAITEHGFVHDTGYDDLILAYNPEEFEKAVESLQAWRKLTGQQQENLRRVWENSILPIRKKVFVFDIFLSRIMGCLGLPAENRTAEFKKSLDYHFEINRRRIGQNEQQQILSQILDECSYAGLEDFLLSLKKPRNKEELLEADPTIAELPSDSLASRLNAESGIVLKRIRTIRSDYDRRSGVFVENFSKKFQEYLYGFVPDDLVKEMQALCAQKGIEHKDFNPRNIVVEWDFENDKPKYDDKGKVKAYLIDWEPKPKFKL